MTPKEKRIQTLDCRGWERVLCVVAHPDDTEYGISAAVNAWTKSGIDVSYLLLTSGEAGMKRAPEVVGPLRAKEQRAACDAVGAGELVILDHPDGHLVEGLDLRRDIARRIRQFRPDAVVTLTFEFEAPHGLNQADHRAAGRAAIDAARDAGNRWIFRELTEDEGLEPWEPDVFLVGQAGDPTHVVAVDDEDVAAAVASLECHREYLADLPDHPKPADFIPPMLANAGALVGERNGVAFRVYELGGVAKSRDDDAREGR
ncbi:PIG-L deacetylase family protein [Corynebacterium freneyi]|uniref:PIG-L deacetylase family protein n=1 Tax=Corynebacterium freneyi TaxID=134034 RepID=UPI001EF24D09|nr:PIG-L deacetylase family protein [Corynebacterium freneyi]MCG7438318.1 PIG-L family deacetylase [Corynebacterium freneyi]